MSQQMKKALKLNGVIVGEYVGSDYYFEDVAAAREFLRQMSTDQLIHTPLNTRKPKSDSATRRA
jgi:hypothetical protein